MDGVYHVIAQTPSAPTASAAAAVTVGPSGLTVTGNLSVARAYHTATLLPSGQVFIAGGEAGDSVVDQAEQFNPASGVFQTMGKMARSGHSATLLLNGDVLFTGGVTSLTGSGPLASAEILKAGSGVFQLTGSMSTPRSGHSATLLQDGRVLVAGGGSATPELYDPGAGTFARRRHEYTAQFPYRNFAFEGEGAGDGRRVGQCRAFRRVIRLPCCPMARS